MAYVLKIALLFS